MSFPGGSPSQSACFPPSLPPQAFSFSLGAAISWPFITPAPPSFSWSLTLQERPFWSAGFHRCWIRSWEVPRLYGRLLRKLLFHSPPEGPEAHSRLLLPDQPDRLPGRDHAVFTGENLCIPFRDPDGGQVWDDLCRFLKEKNPSIAVCG